MAAASSTYFGTNTQRYLIEKSVGLNCFITGFTCSGWYYIETINTGLPIAVHQRHLVSSNGELFMSVQPDLKLRFEFGGSNKVSTGTISLGSWFHVATTYPGGTNQNLLIYINGVLDSTHVNTTARNIMGTIVLGGHQSVPNIEWEGNISDVVFYDRQLSHDEILEIKNNPFGVVKDMIYYPNLRDPNAINFVDLSPMQIGNSTKIGFPTASLNGPPVYFPKLKIN